MIKTNVPTIMNNVKNKTAALYLGIVVLLIAIFMALGFSNQQFPLSDQNTSKPNNVILDTSSYKNFYGISWRGNAHENLRYARHMGHKYVFYQKGMEDDTLANGMHFYVETPEFLIYKRLIDMDITYTEKQQLFYETYCSLKDSSGTFPDNLAKGWFFKETLFTPLLDFQQQRVIDWAINNIMKMVSAIEAKNPKFKFAGMAWDVPQPTGDFWSGIKRPGKPGKQVTLAHWTGGDYGIKHPKVVHDYATYSDGHIQFYKQLYARTREKYPQAKFVMEPYNLYNGWIKIVKDRADAKELMPDLLSQESFGTEFVDDEKIFSTGLITKNNVITTTPNCFSEKDNRLLAAKAAINGSWMTWYGRFGGTGDMPDYSSITQVPARLKLIRVLANWENMNQTPLSARNWDGTVYKSTNAFASTDAIAALQPATLKLFVVFLTAKGEISIPQYKKVASIFKTDDYFIETAATTDDLVASSGKLKLNKPDQIGKGYIIYLKN